MVNILLCVPQLSVYFGGRKIQVSVTLTDTRGNHASSLCIISKGTVLKCLPHLGVHTSSAMERGDFFVVCEKCTMFMFLE